MIFSTKKENCKFLFLFIIILCVLRTTCRKLQDHIFILNTTILHLNLTMSQDKEASFHWMIHC